MNCLVSVIVPVYQAEKYLKNCINDILMQSYSNIEVIIIDDGSTDGSLNICKKLAVNDSRVKVISTDNRGVSSARNLGLENANGEYILFIDADDRIKKNLIEENMKVIDKFQADMVFYNWMEIYENGEMPANIQHEKIYETQFPNTCSVNSECAIRWILESKLQNYVWAYIAKKKIYKDIRFAETIKLGEDAAIILYLINNAKKIAINNNKYYYYIQRQSSATHMQDKSSLSQYYDVLKIQEEFLNDNYPCLRNAFLYYIYPRYLYIYIYLCKCGEWGEDEFCCRLKADLKVLENKICLFNIKKKKDIIKHILFKIRGIEMLCGFYRTIKELRK